VGVERREAEAIYAAGREAVVEVLLRMDRQIQSLTGRVERLERELAKNSKNSSRPPSSDSPSTKKRGRPARPKGPSGKSQGAQPGHDGKGRELLPTMAVDEVVVHWPAGCECGHVFCAAECVAVGDPVRHQVEELPQISTIVVEHADARHPPSEADPAHLRWQEAPLQAHPRPREEPAQDLGSPVDVRQGQERHPDQQSRRARTARRGHLPQALTRQPISRRRNSDRPIAVGAHHLPPPSPQPV
jgi:hypothetical protein